MFTVCFLLNIYFCYKPQLFEIILAKYIRTNKKTKLNFSELQFVEKTVQFVLIISETRFFEIHNFLGIVLNYNKVLQTI